MKGGKVGLAAVCMHICSSCNVHMCFQMHVAKRQTCLSMTHSKWKVIILVHTYFHRVGETEGRMTLSIVAFMQHLWLIWIMCVWSRLDPNTDFTCPMDAACPLFGNAILLWIMHRMSCIQWDVHMQYLSTATKIYIDKTRTDMQSQTMPTMSSSVIIPTMSSTISNSKNSVVIIAAPLAVFGVISMIVVLVLVVIFYRHPSNLRMLLCAHVQ